MRGIRVFSQSIGFRRRPETVLCRGKRWRGSIQGRWNGIDWAAWGGTRCLHRSLYVQCYILQWRCLKLPYNSTVCLTTCRCWQQGKHQSSALLSFFRGTHSFDFHHKGSVMRIMFMWWYHHEILAPAKKERKDLSVTCLDSVQLMSLVLP